MCIQLRNLIKLTRPRKLMKLKTSRNFLSKVMQTIKEFWEIKFSPWSFLQVEHGASGIHIL